MALSWEKATSSTCKSTYPFRQTQGKVKWVIVELKQSEESLSNFGENDDNDDNQWSSQKWRLL